MKLNALARSLALLGLGSSVMGLAHAQDATAPVQRMDKVEITGSSIKRVQDEGMSAVQVFKADDLVKMGITSAEQLVATLSSNGAGIDNMTTNQGGDFLGSTADRAHNNGASGASLRGLGAQYTLVLLNGRRVSTHGLSGKSVDLNSIPMAAVERIEILKDGASAIYGTDAIGGVINFILKKEVRGLEVTAFTDRTQHGHGNISRGSLLGGAGDLAKDGFNLFASLTYDTNDRLRGENRSFVNGYQPSRGLSPDTTGTPYATIVTAPGTALPYPTSGVALPGGTQVYNRLNPLGMQGKCETVPDMHPYRSDVIGFPTSALGCSYDYGRDWSLMQPVDRTNLVSRATFALTPEHLIFAEVVASRTKSAVEYTPVQPTGGNYAVPASSAYYQNLALLFPTLFKSTNTDPTDTRVFFDATKPERIRWRCLECGPRQQNTSTDADRALLGMEGTLSNWDYKLGLSTARSSGNTVLGDGNMYIDKFKAAMQSGLINPFLLPGQTQTPQALALIDAAKATGAKLYAGTAAVSEFDGTISGDLAKLPAGPLGAAVGFDVRRETYRFNSDPSSTDNIFGVGAPAGLPEVGRNIKAVFGELAVPIVKGLDMQLAARYDHYSDFGSTTNPKVGLRWQPAQQLMFRGSYSTGFHAPDFDPLYGGASNNSFNSDINDPLLCPGGVGKVGCGIRPDINTVSNPNLKPEKSKQLSLGVVFSPASWLTTSVDFWQLQLTDKIAALSGPTVIDQYAQYKQYVQRDPVTNEIIAVNAPYLNLAGDKASGVDLNITANYANSYGRWLFTFDGSYLGSYKSRYLSSDPWTERVGTFGDANFGWDLHLRWKHALSLTWAQGDWSATMNQTYSSGYQSEQDGYGAGFNPIGAPARVSSYTLYHLSASYTGYKNLTLTAGIKNLFDTKPPYSSQDVDNVAGAGWDARVGDPRLRSFTLRASYKFW
ncbi:MAG: TonB-dependent receptor [Paucibacter sp.]|nr:TonB-dependent receptor [Roseateles sp.]